MKNASFLIIFTCMLSVSACNRPSSTPQAQTQSSGSTQASPPPAVPRLAEGECGAPDGARGFVRITSTDLTGAYQRCSFDLSTGGAAALEAKQVGDKESSIIVLSLNRAGAIRCEKDSPVAVNYRAQNPSRVLYVASAG